MTDNQFEAARTSLELLDSVPESLLRRVKQYSGRLATEAVHVMGDRLPFFADLEASQRASVQLVVQTALVNFAEWMRNPRGDVGYTAEAFALVPQELTRRIALRQTVDMVRVTMEHFEEAVPMLARNEDQMTALTVGILRYSRNLAFAAASGYADAAESRGAWDTRIEANVVDAVVRGDVGPELQSQAAALNWDATAPATVIVGLPHPDRVDLVSDDVHAIATRNGRTALSDVHGTWLVAIVSGQLSHTDRTLGELLEVFADGPVVVGPTAPTLSGAHHSATEAIAGMNAVAGWRARRGRWPRASYSPNARCLATQPQSPHSTRRSCARSPMRGPRSSRRSTRTWTPAAPSRRAHAPCSFIQTRSATASNASPTSPDAIRPRRATPTSCGWPSTVGRLNRQARLTSTANATCDPANTSGCQHCGWVTRTHRSREDLGVVPSHAVLWELYKNIRPGS